MAKKQPAATDQPAAPEADNISSLKLDLGEPQTPATETPAVEATEPTPEPVAENEPVVGADEPALLPSRDAVQLARQRGYEVSDDATDDDFWSRVEENETRAEKAEREAEQLRQRIAQYEAQQSVVEPEPKSPVAQTAPTPSDAADDLEIPDRPEHDQVNVQILQFAQANGKLTEAPGGYLTTEDSNFKPQVDAFNKTLQAQRAYDAEWTPRKIAATEYERLARKDREERESLKRELAEIKAQRAHDGVQGEINAYFDKHKAAYFALGPDGEPVWDPQQQTYVGEGYARYMAAVQEAVDLGATDRAAIHKYAAKHAPPTAPVATTNEPPAKKVVQFRNRLKTNGHADTLPTPPVSRPAAGANTRDVSGLSLHQQLTANFSNLMSEKVADRM